MNTERHQVIHQVIFCRHGMEDICHHSLFVIFSYRAKTKMRSFLRLLFHFICLLFQSNSWGEVYQNPLESPITDADSHVAKIHRLNHKISENRVPLVNSHNSFGFNVGSSSASEVSGRDAVSSGSFSAFAISAREGLIGRLTSTPNARKLSTCPMRLPRPCESLFIAER